MSDLCPNCAREVALDERVCRICGADALAPNVRYASRDGEIAALAKREKRAVSAAKKKKAVAALDRLRDLAQTSRLVINRKLRALSLWVESDDELYVNFYRLRQLGVRMVDDRFNRHRISAENTISPLFFEQLVVGALTIDGKGMPYYGGWSVLIRDADIRVRATVFWENPFTFNKRKRIVSGDDPPEGYRTTWGRRDSLAVAKLGDRLDSTDDDSQLAKRFMGPDRASEHCDFIEVHVHGPIHADAIEEVVEPSHMSAADRTDWKHLRKKLEAKGIIC